MEPTNPAAASPSRFSLGFYLGAHGAASALYDVIVNAPILAAHFGVVAAFALVQFGVLAACTGRVGRHAS